jgi:hypothetical protein
MSRNPFAVGSPVSVRDRRAREAYTGEIVGVEGNFQGNADLPEVVEVSYAGQTKRFDAFDRRALDGSQVFFDIF